MVEASFSSKRGTNKCLKIRCVLRKTVMKIMEKSNATLKYGLCLDNLLNYCLVQFSPVNYIISLSNLSLNKIYLFFPSTFKLIF